MILDLMFVVGIAMIIAGLPMALVAPIAIWRALTPMKAPPLPPSLPPPHFETPDPPSLRHLKPPYDHVSRSRGAN